MRLSRVHPEPKKTHETHETASIRAPSRDQKLPSGTQARRVPTMPLSWRTTRIQRAGVRERAEHAAFEASFVGRGPELERLLSALRETLDTGRPRVPGRRGRAGDRQEPARPRAGLGRPDSDSRRHDPAGPLPAGRTGRQQLGAGGDAPPRVRDRRRRPAAPSSTPRFVAGVDSVLAPLGLFRKREVERTAQALATSAGIRLPGNAVRPGRTTRRPGRDHPSLEPAVRRLCASRQNARAARRHPVGGRVASDAHRGRGADAGRSHHPRRHDAPRTPGGASGLPGRARHRLADAVSAQRRSVRNVGLRPPGRPAARPRELRASDHQPGPRAIRSSSRRRSATWSRRAHSSAREASGALAATETTGAIPGSLASVLTARIEALPLDERRVLQEAAVVGRYVLGGIAAPRPGRCRHRRSAGAPVGARPDLRPRPSTSLPGQAEWQFKHVLVTRRRVRHDVRTAARPVACGRRGVADRPRAGSRGRGRRDGRHARTDGRGAGRRRRRGSLPSASSSDRPPSATSCTRAIGPGSDRRSIEPSSSTKRRCGSRRRRPSTPGPGGTRPGSRVRARRHPGARAVPAGADGRAPGRPAGR